MDNFLLHRVAGFAYLTRLEKEKAYASLLLLPAFLTK
jgi:hypothetical protein